MYETMQRQRRLKVDRLPQELTGLLVGWLA